MLQNYRAAEDIVQDDEVDCRGQSTVEELQRKLEETSKLCQSLLGDQGMGQLARQTSAGKNCYSVNFVKNSLNLQHEFLFFSLNIFHLSKNMLCKQVSVYKIQWQKG